MKQIIIRIIPGVQTVYDVIFGEILDSQFVPQPVDDFNYPIPSFVHCDGLLGGTSYIKSSDFFLFIQYYSHRCSNMAFFPNLITFNLDPRYEEEKDSQIEER